MFRRIVKKFVYLIAPGVIPRFRLLFQLLQLLQLRCKMAGRSLPEVVEQVSASPFAPVQKKQEITSLLSFLQQKRPIHICEVGGAAGGTLFLFSHIAPPGARLLSIDLGYTSFHQSIYRRFAKRNQTITCLAANSHLPETVETVRRWLAGSSLDFLFIDGEHTLEGVTRDFYLYSPLVRKGGWIAFHDIVTPRIPNPNQQVPVFWADLKKRYSRVLEFVENPDQDGYGIGLIEV